MSIGGATETKSKDTSPASEARSADRAQEIRDADAARNELSARTEEVTAAEVETVADRVVGDVDAYETAGDVAPEDRAGETAGGVGVAETPDAGAVNGAEAVVPEVEVVSEVEAPPETALTPEHRAQVEAFRDRFAEIDAFEHDIRARSAALAAGDPRSPHDLRRETLDELTTFVNGIEDPVQRENTIRAIAVEAGRQAGRLAERGPYAAYTQLEALGAGTSLQTGRLLAHGALQTGAGSDNFVVYGRGDNPVAQAMTEIRSGRRQAFADFTRTFVPFVDAGARLVEGDVPGAVVSGGVDLAGGALVRSGRAVATVVGGAVLFTPSEAEASVLNVVRRIGQGTELVIDGATTLQGGRRLAPDVTVAIRQDGVITRSLRLADPRAKHNQLNNLTEADLETVARQLSRGRRPSEFAIARSEGQFTGYFNTLAGQAQLAQEVMEQLTEVQLQAIRNGGPGPVLRLSQPVGLTPENGGVVVANSVRVLSNGDGGFHLVPVP